LDFVKIFSTLLTKVLFRGALGTKDAYTRSMLPHFANIALHKKSGDVFAELN
jgi:hypothetical protein